MLGSVESKLKKPSEMKASLLRR